MNHCGRSWPALPLSPVIIKWSMFKVESEGSSACLSWTEYKPDHIRRLNKNKLKMMCHRLAPASAAGLFNKAHHVCGNACKKSLAICRKSRSLCPVSKLLSVPIQSTYAEQGR